MKNMRIKSWIYKTVASLAFAGMALVSANNVQALQFTYASEVGSFINFDGAAHFNFTPAVNSFKVTSGTAANFLGDISGTYTIGAITTVGGVSSAPVTGTGTFVIHDPVGPNNFSATLVWINIAQFGTGGTLNVNGTANLTAISYSGSNSDLLAIKNAVGSANTLTFQFVPAVLLADLKSTGTHATSFSGSVGTVPDGGTTVALLGFALAGMGLLRWTMKAAKA